MLSALREASRPAIGYHAFVQQRLERTAPVVAVLAVAALVVPALLGMANASYLWSALLVTLITVPFAMREPAESRRLFLSLWVVAFFLRVALLIAIYHASVAAGGPFLGPDSAQFLRESHVMADREFSLGVHPIAVFETYDVAHYYIYAFLIRAFGADLFALQLFNCGLTALAAPLLYSAGRVVLPRWALLLGVLIAINPSLMVLSIRDLLKDPSILAAISIALWAVVHLGYQTRWSSKAAYGVTAAAALSYLHMDRFYVAAYLAIAAMAAFAVFVWRGHGRVRASVVVPILLVFVAAEAGPMALGWPSSFSILNEQVRYVTRTSAMLQSETGLTERALISRASLRAAAAKTDGGVKTLEAAPGSDAFGPDAAGPQRPGLIGFAIGVVKRLFGPFVWVLPPQWTITELLRGDYMLYPGTLVWYVALPLAVIGCGMTFVRTLQGRERDAVMIGLAVFCVLYFAQYVAINLSYRQRDVMFPFVAVFTFVGAQIVVGSRPWRKAFYAYWVLLGTLAFGHLTVRFFFA